MKFGQLIEYNKRTIFLEKSFSKCDGESTPRSFSEKTNFTYHWINILKFHEVCFIVCLVEGYQIISKAADYLLLPHPELF